MKNANKRICPCGSGKLFENCCMSKGLAMPAELHDAIQQTVSMNPNLSLDDLNVVLQKRVDEQNNKPQADFCGLSANQMTNWLYAPLSELKNVTIQTPSDLSASPVMRYLEVILDAIIEQGGALKATTKGNLPAALVKRASELLPEFALAEFNDTVSISDYAGSNEDKFNALHYTRVQAQLAGIIAIRKGKFQLTRWAQTQYPKLGINGFFPALLEAATKRYNWGYFDLWSEDIPLREFWLFMVWRIQKHGALEQLTEETAIAFPDVLDFFEDDKYQTPKEQLRSVIETRFLTRFLEFFGFVVVNPRIFNNGKRVPTDVRLLPMLAQTFQFSVS
ncbi:SecC motif-containing protein [Idiomarina tyrosinivorans]|uniref:SecC motif-containing protein n=1 Tax=Idiomarina tyrosinivorans TaxID=1445662 RepID=A0A432ZPZ6_9GAMM|nr:SEC-C domain-containing protein [Idiomarina tyrosinivorans]RUO79967.1 SecC motif-containing protein [Idiomarina tyrosinivorans]